MMRRQRTRANIQRGMTLLELIIATSILLILASAALPVNRLAIKRQKEFELREALREMRSAIDRYKDASDKNLIQVEIGTEGYPKTLDVLVNGVELATAKERRVRFLRRIPVDPMIGRADWGMRSVQDDPRSGSWGGQNVFDVYSRSSGTALDGSRYADW
ncbi:MAG TPA: type II secretion system protein [Candidatus Acidoferrales bacterium]|nr:type II secretion system protein [Candidatus Acidoferrales bacterium]